MPINVFVNSSSSYDNGNTIFTSLFVQKPYLRANNIESNIEEHIDLKQLGLKIYQILLALEKQHQKILLIII